MADGKAVDKSMKYQCEINKLQNIEVYTMDGRWVKTLVDVDISEFTDYGALNWSISDYVSTYPQDYDLGKSTKKSKSTSTFSEQVNKQRAKNNKAVKMRGSIDSDDGDLSENLDTVIKFLTEMHNWNQDERVLKAMMLLEDVKMDAERGVF